MPGNLPRVLPDGVTAVLEESRWSKPPIFSLIAQLGAVSRDEMFNTFNMGLGMTVVLAAADVQPALELLKARGLDAWDVGVIEAGTPGAEAEARVDP